MKALSVIVTLVVAAVVVVASPVTAQLISEQDREFVHKANASNLAEVELGRLAVQRAANPAVRSFGDRMVQDHGRAHAELVALAQRKALDVPPTFEASHQAMRDRLSVLSGADFDRAYMQEMVRDHTQDVAELERATQIVTDPEIKTWAARMLPVVQEHLVLARQVNTQIVLGPAPPAALPAAVVVPWCGGAYAPAGGSNFGTCNPVVR